MIIVAELNAFKKQLDALESIERNKSIPHHESMIPSDAIKTNL